MSTDMLLLHSVFQTQAPAPRLVAVAPSWAVDSGPDRPTDCFPRPETKMAQEKRYQSLSS